MSECGPSRPFPVDDATLVAYADGMLRGARRRRLDRLVRGDPAVAARAAVYAEQRRRLGGLRTALPMADSVDFHPELVAAVADRLRRHRRTRRLAVAAVLALLLSSGALLRTMETTRPSLGRPVATAGDVAGHAADAVRFQRPDLRAFGLRLVAEATLPRARVPAVRLVYEDAEGAPVYLVVGVVQGEEAEAIGTVPEGYVALEWRRGPTLLALVAPSGRPWMRDVMKEVERSLLEPPAAPPPGGVVPAADGGAAVEPPDPAADDGGAATL